MRQKNCTERFTEGYGLLNELARARKLTGGNKPMISFVENELIGSFKGQISPVRDRGLDTAPIRKYCRGHYQARYSGVGCIQKQHTGCIA